MEREKLAERILFLTGSEEDNDPTGELQEAFCN